MKNTLKLSLYLVLRALMVSVLCFMTSPITSNEGFGWLLYVFAVFYLIVLFYFIIFTAWTVGCRDKIKVDAGRQKSCLARGFIGSGIVFGAMIVIFLLAVVLKDAGLFGQIVNTVNLILSFCVSFVLIVFTGAAGYSTGWLGFTVFCFVMVACIAAGGISYIIGAKNIKFIQPWLDKWKR